MRKQSMMESSKYEFNPKQFDSDIQNNMKIYLAKREMIKDELGVRLIENIELSTQLDDMTTKINLIKKYAECEEVLNDY